MPPAESRARSTGPVNPLDSGAAAAPRPLLDTPFRRRGGSSEARPGAAQCPRGPPVFLSPPGPLPLIHGDALLRGTLARVRPSRLTPCQGTPVTAGQPPAGAGGGEGEESKAGDRGRRAQPTATAEPHASPPEAPVRHLGAETAGKENLISGARSPPPRGEAVSDWLAAAKGRNRARRFCSGGGSGGGAMSYVPGQPVTAVVVRRGRDGDRDRDTAPGAAKRDGDGGGGGTGAARQRPAGCHREEGVRWGRRCRRSDPGQRPGGAPARGCVGGVG